MSFIENLTIGEAITIFIFVEGVVGSIFVYFNKFYNIKKKTEDTKENIKENTETLKELTEQIKQQREDYKIMKNNLMISSRYHLTQSCIDAIKKGEIDSTKLRSIIDLYESYKNLGGNSYVSELVEKVEDLKVV